MQDRRAEFTLLKGQKIFDSFLDHEQRIRIIEKRQSKQSWMELATTLTGLFLTSALINTIKNRKAEKSIKAQEGGGSNRNERALPD